MKRTFFLCFLGCLILGCVPPRYPTGIQDIHSTLQESHQIDRKISNQDVSPSSASSSLVNDALMPKPALNLASNHNPQEAEERFDVAVKDVPARNFFMGLVQGTSYNMVVSPQVQGTISMNLKNVTVQEALDAVRDTYGYEYHETAYGFEVLPLTIQTQIFAVNYLDVARKGISETEVNPTEISQVVGTTTSGTQQGGSTTPQQAPTSGATQTPTVNTVDTTSNVNFWKTLEDSLKLIVGDKDGRSVIVNPTAGIVIVRAYPAELREVAHYLNNAQDTMARQVVIEAKILEVQLDKNFQSGINWNIIGFSTNGTTGGMLIPGNNSPTDPNLPENFFAYTQALMTGKSGDFQGVIQLLETQGNVQVLSSPRVSTVNNEKAIIKVGGDQFFVTSVTSNVTPTNGTATTSSSVGLTPFFAGITLDVTPQISDSGQIILHIHPAVSTVKDQNKVINLGGPNNTLDLPLAASTIRESDSIVRAQNGQIIVLGGLIQNDTEENLEETPGLSRIPIIGTLFRNTGQIAHKSELVILLRPVVVNNSAWMDDIQNTDNRFKAINRGFHVGGFPETFGTEGEHFTEQIPPQ